jgi:branched-chain amino acid transport system ATP-binding protein
MSILELSGVAKSFGGLRAVDGVHLSVVEGSITGLIGPNGSGKTTLFNLITGVQRPSAGTIRFAERDIQRLPTHRIAQLGLVRTYQKTTVFPLLTARENVQIGTFLRARAHFLAGLLHLPAERRERAALARDAAEILEFLGMGESADTPAHNLPYGMLRHLEIGIALAAGPRLLLLDEPAAGLNPEETQALMRTLQQIRDRGVTMLLVEHDMRLVMGICDRITVINQGVVIAEGAPGQVSRDPDVIRVYLGEDLEL